MNFHQQTVTRKLTIAFTVLVAIIIGVSVLSIASLSASQREFEEFVSQEFSRGGLARDIRAAASARAVAARNLILLNGKEDIDAETVAVKAAHERVKERIGVLKETLLKSNDASIEERELFRALEEIESKYGPVAMDIVAMALAGQKEQAIEKMNAECQPLLKKLIGTTSEYTKLIATSGDKEIARAQKNFSKKRLTLIVSSVLATLAAIALATLINRSLMQSLGVDPHELRAIAKLIATGNLSAITGAKRATQDSVLASLAEMQSALAEIVGRVRSAASTIESGTQEIASGSFDLSQRTEMQAINVQRSASSMEKMTATVRHNSVSANQASELASAARLAAERGGEVVSGVVNTMHDISMSSRKISEITSVIDGIAFQTNILALNAAVEAARAGEQGRGFAVVAGEVRTLAQRSAHAAKEIKTLISESVSKVTSGSELVNDAGLAMTKIVDEVSRVASLIETISSATSEQSNGIELISDAVIQLDQSTQQNATLVDQMAETANSLKHQAQGLVEVVAVFAISEGDPKARALLT